MKMRRSKKSNNIKTQQRKPKETRDEIREQPI